MDRSADLALVRQHLAITKAIALLQSELDRMTDTTSPETAKWSDVATFAKAADMAQAVVDQYSEDDDE